MDSSLILFFIKIYFLLSLLFLGFTAYAYRINAKLPPDDPLKQDYQLVTLLPIPFWPLFAAARIVLFFVEAVLYMIFLILFTIGLVVIRKPVQPTRLSKIATKIGNTLLKANMLWIRMIFPQQKVQTLK